MRKRFLEQRHDGTLTALVLSGKLTDHLLEIDRTAREQIKALRDRTFSPAFAVIQLRLNELRLGFGRRLLRRRFRLSRFCRLLFRFGLLCGRRACTKQHRQHQQTCNPFFINIPLPVDPEAARGVSVLDPHRVINGNRSFCSTLCGIIFIRFTGCPASRCRSRP